MVEVIEMKGLEMACLLGMAATICCSGFFQTAQSRASLESSVLRLHILANSDSIDDQALKLKVRDAILEEMTPLLETADTLEETEVIAATQLEMMEETARSVIAAEGAAYDVQASLVTMPFEARTYDTFTMPAGTYEAVRITIGEAAGENWWCVMYPSLCVPAATDADQTDVAHTYFSTAQQELLEHPQRYQVRLKCLDWLEQWLT